MENNNTKKFELDKITVLGAREHNLKNINVEIPRDELTVITGISGSGKSSLAFDTLYAEGQRRYIESLSPYAKQFMGMLKKPEVDKIEGLSPAISIEQKTLSRNPRSTVGTVTEIYDYLRLLFAKIGTQYSVEHNVPVEQKSQDQIINEILDKFDGEKIQILSPIIRGRKGHYRELFDQFRKQGYTKVRIDGTVQNIEEGLQLSRYKIHDIELVIDRLKISEEIEQRLSESVELALRKGDGILYVLFEDKEGWKEKSYSIHYTCPISGKAYDKLSPNMFSFNSPYGACEKCDGLGYLKNFDPELLIEDEEKSVNKGGIAFLDNKKSILYKQVTNIADVINLDLDKPIKDLSKDTLDALIFGKEDLEIESQYKFGKDKITYKHKFPGLISILNHQHKTAPKSRIKKMNRYMTEVTCKKCEGGRLNETSLHVKIAGKNIYDITSMTIDEAKDFLTKKLKSLDKKEKLLSNIIVKEVTDRLEFLENVGLTYLTLHRRANTLSGGESQRIRLASQIGSKLVGIMYVLDEPSIGLHQHDNYRLIKSLKDLKDLGNTLIVVEHDKSMILEADNVIDIGPGAGIHGGEILFNNSPKELLASKNSKSITKKYLKNEKDIEYSSKRREGNGKYLTIENAVGNNLKDVTLQIPLGKMVLVTGMSGSGKSSLINDTLVPVLKRKFYNALERPLPHGEIKGIENIDKVIEIDQSPIGRTPRSNPATYTGLFTEIRDLFTKLPESKIRGYDPGRFSFNVKGGRCDECEGAGMKKIEMNFLPDVYVKCEVCDGKRYNKETLQVKYKHNSIADVLEMTVEEALKVFKDIPKIHRKLKILNDVGLGYIRLGQQSPTLSGGEAQRVKLATELSKRNTGKTLFLLDEPTTGLHFEDIRMLQKLLDKLVEKGNTVVIIEHNLDVVKCADWIIDLGPEGGKHGGEIIFEGTPEDIVKNKRSLTGKYLKEELK